MLHITNGDVVADSMRQAGLRGEIVPWRDVLHEGPVPGGLPHEALSEIRSRYLAGQGWGDYPTIRAQFAARDAACARLADFDLVLLWFEPDLYDQLQLLQVLDRCARADPGGTTIGLIALKIAGDQEREGLFRRFADLSADEIRAALPPVIDYGDGAAGWEAFTAPDPMGVQTLADTPLPGLPHLRAALRRHLEQFPSVQDGLSRTERQALEHVAAGLHHPVPLFLEDQMREEAVFLGDWAFWSYLCDLTRGENPLLTTSDGDVFRTPAECREAGDDFAAQALTLTPAGRDVLDGRADAVALNGIDRWRGGVHLSGRSVPWRWDRRSGRLVRVGEGPNQGLIRAVE